MAGQQGASISHSRPREFTQTRTDPAFEGGRIISLRLDSSLIQTWGCPTLKNQDTFYLSSHLHNSPNFPVLHTAQDHHEGQMTYSM